MVIAVTVSVFHDEETEPKVSEFYVVECPDCLSGDYWLDLVSGEAIEKVAREVVQQYHKSIGRAPGPIKD